MEHIILKSITVNCELVKYEFSVTDGLKRFLKSSFLFCNFGMDMSDVPQSILSIPFVGTFIGLCWLENSILWLPEIDQSYYDGLKNVKLAYAEMYQDHPMKGRLIPAKFVENNFQATENAMLLFGGGVDAHTTFVRHINEITDLINIQGWYASENVPTDKVSEYDFSHCANVASENKKTFVGVKSNFAQVFNANIIDKYHSKKLHDAWWHGIQHSMAFISIAIPVAFKKGIHTIYIGSSKTIGDRNTCASVTTTDSEYRYANIGKVVHDAFELNRQDKVKVITDYQKHSHKPYPLKVCSFHENNCCQCEKCFRTIIAIVAEGSDPRLFGFHIDGSLKEYFVKVVHDKIALWGVSFEWEIYWQRTARRMRENYNNVLEKDFADWFLNYNFLVEKKKALMRYYQKNFFSILSRKFLGILKR